MSEPDVSNASVLGSSLLKLSPGLLVSSQGGAERQTDLSIRGSSFSAAGLSINGMALDNPQTEHFNAELPLPGAIFHSQRILTGSRQSIITDGNLVGSLDFKLTPVETGGYADLLIGELGRNRQSFLYEDKLDAVDGLGLGGFAVREQSGGLDYADNDFSLEGGGARLQHRLGDRQTDLVIGLQDKEFGARGYYGVSPDYYAEERIEDALFLLSSIGGGRVDSGYRFNLLGRRIADDYRLWLPSSLYHNQHVSRIVKADVAGRSTVYNGISANWLFFAGSEDISSDSLGNESRDNAGVALMPSLDLGEYEVSAGMRTEVFEDDSPAWLPQFRMDCSLNDLACLYIEYSESVRQPSYTELNYESPGSLGNAGLKRQESASTELGINAIITDGLEGNVAVFSRKSRNSVDWVKASAGDRWTATDMGDVETVGVELGLSFAGPQSLFQGEAHYQYLDKSNGYGQYSSRYMLDYARHLLQLSLKCRLSEHLSIQTQQGLRYQHENRLRDGSDFGVPATLELCWSPKTISPLSFTAGVDNLWNDHFQQMPGQRAYERALFMAARWAL